MSKWKRSTIGAACVLASIGAALGTPVEAAPPSGSYNGASSDGIAVYLVVSGSRVDFGSGLHRPPECPYTDDWEGGTPPSGATLAGSSFSFMGGGITAVSVSGTIDDAGNASGSIAFFDAANPECDVSGTWSATIAGGGSTTTTTTTTSSTTTTSTTTSTTAPPAPTPPSAPRTLTATAAAGAVRLNFFAPTSSGGTAITDYVVQRSANGSTGWVTVADGVNTTTTALASGLIDGTRYYFRVLAVNGAGQGPASNVVAAVPRTVPSVPRSLTATAGARQVRLSWLAPASNGGAAITDYVVQRSANGTSGWVTIDDGVRATTGSTVTGLTNGVRYYFRVVARNAAGTSPVSNVVSGVPRTAPSAPTVRATAGTRRVTLTWSPRSTGGAPITRFAIQRSTSPTSGWRYLSTSLSATTRTYTATGLSNGVRYYFRVVAINAAGRGVWSRPVSAVPFAASGRPPSGGGDINLNLS